jgi:hypothetical protein
MGALSCKPSNDDDLVARAIGGMHAVEVIEAANERYGGGYDEATVDGRGTAAPFVREQDGRDCWDRLGLRRC